MKRAARPDPRLTPQERAILDDLKARVAAATHRCKDAQADILAAKVYAVAALEALPPEHKSDGKAA
jgi:hypothetical protein